MVTFFQLHASEIINVTSICERSLELIIHLLLTSVPSTDLQKSEKNVAILFVKVILIWKSVSSLEPGLRVRIRYDKELGDVGF